MRMTRMLMIAVVVVTCLSLVIAGCPKVKQAREATQAARELQEKGETTITGEDGEQITVKTDDEGETSSVTVEGKEGSATVDTEGGTTHIQTTDEEGKTTTAHVEQTATEADVGIKFYPGATVGEGLTSSVSGAESGSTAVVELHTSDPVSKVVSFYKGKYGSGAQIVSQGEGTMIMLPGDNGAKMIMIMPDEEQGGTKIALSSHAGG